MTATEPHRALTGVGEASPGGLDTRRSLLLLHALKDQLAVLGVRAEIREHLMGLVVFGPVPSLPLFVTVSEGGRFFAWQSSDGRHRVDDLTGAARRLSASIRSGIGSAATRAPGSRTLPVPDLGTHGQVDAGEKFVDSCVSTPLRVMTSQSSWKCARTYPARRDQVRLAREFLARVLDGCPKVEDAVYICSELCTNAIIHSNSSKPGGYFILRAEVHEGDYLWVEVEDQGGPWVERDSDNEHGRGLEVVGTLADTWDIEGDELARVVSARLDWPTELSSPVQMNGVQFRPQDGKQENRPRRQSLP